MNVEEAGKVLAYLNSFYPHVQLTELTPVVWADIFAKNTVDEVMSAAKMVVRKSDYFPSVAAIIQIIEASDELTCLSWGEVWDSIRQQIGNVGANGRPVLSDLEREVIAGLGGWRVMCQSQLDDIHKRGPRILESSKVLVRQKRTLAQLDGQIGLAIGRGDGNADD